MAIALLAKLRSLPRIIAISSHTYVSRTIRLEPALSYLSVGLQRSTLSGHRMTTGFGPFELPTCGLLQTGRDHSPPKAYPALNWLSQYYKYTVAKQNGGGTEWVELFIALTRGMGEPTYGLLLSLVINTVLT